MFKSTTTLLALTLTAASVASADYVCPGGHAYAIADLGDQRGYRVFDNYCNVVETDTYPLGTNVCMIDKFKCSPEPITITGAYVDGYWYDCVQGSGSCKGNSINVCVMLIGVPVNATF
ncbi:hypothetical protein EIP91_003642 [Steccherinum ochraceum]|uniref:Uncharacterized protein n=1 Tax=Steccherinum ochraceum TaxID=92696 RepID=A0A4R0RBM0_9APHY|nr:hypothetical protein EIP91_003642 [Steccherinum ochraceum]